MFKRLLILVFVCHFGSTAALACMQADSTGDQGRNSLMNRLPALPMTGRDRDGDGLPDLVEKEYGTNPNQADTDKDGIVDSDEVLIYRTNPLRADSDADGLSDREEVMRFRTLPNDADTDKDGLNDGEEVLVYRTDPLQADSDNDGLSDGEEVLRFGTNPLRADTDGDGLKDGEEVYSYLSDPTSVDSDGDGVADAEDKCPTQPVAPGSYSSWAGCPEERPHLWVEVDEVIVLSGVSFSAGMAAPSPESIAMMEKVYTTLIENPELSFEIRGYADATGDAALNLRLSQQRAQAVCDFLVQQGIDAGRLRAIGYGEENPIASNDTPEGRARNRRIELHRLR